MTRIGVLSSSQIAAIVRRDPVLSRSNFLGTVYRDRIARVKRSQNQWMIVDLQPSGSTGVGHFCLLGAFHGTGVYCDPVGSFPPDAAAAWLRDMGARSTVVNHVQIEPLGSDLCGWFCLLIARSLLADARSLAEVVATDFWTCRADTDLPGEQNDRIVRAQVARLRW